MVFSVDMKSPQLLKEMGHIEMNASTMFLFQCRHRDMRFRVHERCQKLVQKNHAHGCSHNAVPLSSCQWRMICL